MEVFTTRTDSPESRALGLPPGLLHSISSGGEMLFGIGHWQDGPLVGYTLTRVPLAGGAPRPILEANRPHWVDWTPGGETFALLHSDENGSRVEYPRGKVIRRTQDNAWDLRVSPAGDALAFCESRGGSHLAVVILDRAGKVVAQSRGWSVPAFIEWIPRGCVAWAPDGREVWFAAARPGRESGLYALTRGGRVRPLLRIPGSLALLDISRDGRALLSQVNRRVSLMARAPGETEEKDLSWFDSSSLADLSADGRRLLFTEYGEGGGAKAAVYLRGTDGSPAVRLGNGLALALSPDAKWALASSATEANRLFLLPTGAGEPRALPQAPMAVVQARWLAGGRQILIAGVEPGQGSRLYLLDAGTGRTRPLTRPGTAFGVPSPDGSRFAAWSAGGVITSPIGREEPRPVPGVRSMAEGAVQWRADGRALYIGRLTEVSRFRIDEVDLATGRRTRWKDLRSGSPDALIWTVMMTPDGQAYAYDTRVALATLYLVEGLR